MKPEPAEFAEFFTQWEPHVRRYLVWLEGDLAVIDDATQETMISAHRYWDRVQELENVRAWLFRVARQRLARVQRLGKQQEVITDPYELPVRKAAVRQDVLSLREDQLAILEAVRKLPRQQAVAIALQLQHDLPLREIAEIMGVSVGTVKAHLHHARATLETLLSDLYGGAR